MRLALLLHSDPNNVINNKQTLTAAFLGYLFQSSQSSMVSMVYRCCVVFVDMAEVTPCKRKPNERHEERSE